MHHIFSTLLCSAILFSASASGGTIYKCKNPQGTLLYQEKPCSEESQSVASWGSAAGAPFTIDQGSHGQYFVDGLVNGQKLNFLVDTGASYVSLPQNISNAAGLSCLRQITMRTANGLASSCTTIIKTLKFGTFTLSNVEATISPNLDQPLLGMNILNKFRIEQDGGAMRLTIK